MSRPRPRACGSLGLVARAWCVLAAILTLTPGVASAQTRALDGPRPDHGYGGFTLQRFVASGEGGAKATGGGVSFRIHGAPALALDLGLGVHDGRDALGRRRSDVPLSLTALLYPLPSSAVQFYAPVGLGYDWSRVDLPGGSQARWRHLGVAAGLGVEVYLTSYFSVFVDLRGFVRWRTGGDPGPEFQTNRGLATDTSGGAFTSLGVAWYPLGKNAR